MLILPTRRTSIPFGVKKASSYWVRRGLRSLYLLNAEQWRWDCVTGSIGGTLVGLGPDFQSDGWLLTRNNVSYFGILELNLKEPEAPLTIIAGWQRISGSVSWSLLANTSAWSGIYGIENGKFVTTRNNSFDGSPASVGTNYAVCRVIPEQGVYAYGSGGQYSAATSFADFSDLLNRTSVALGLARRNGAADDNPSASVFTHFAAIQGPVSDAEAFALARNPWMLFAERRIFVPVTAAAGSNLPTLSNPTIVPGSLTGTGFRPRVTITF